MVEGEIHRQQGGFQPGAGMARLPAAPLNNDLYDRELCGGFNLLSQGHQEVVRKMVKMLLKVEKSEGGVTDDRA